MAGYECGTHKNEPNITAKEKEEKAENKKSKKKDVFLLTNISGFYINDIKEGEKAFFFLGKKEGPKTAPLFLFEERKLYPEAMRTMAIKQGR